MPTGQAVASALGMHAADRRGQLEAAAASAEPGQVAARGRRLPRAHAALVLRPGRGRRHGGGQHLGPVGSTLVAEVLIGLVRRSDDSILRLARLGADPAQRHAGHVQAGRPAAPSPASCRGTPAAPPTYTVAAGRHPVRHRQDASSATPTAGRRSSPSTGPDPQPRPDLPRPGPDPAGHADAAQAAALHGQSGDTLTGIAQKKLGDANRWPEIRQLNRDVVLNPADISPGMELVIVKR